MMGFFFNEQPVTDLASAQASDTARYGTFFHAMLEQGIYLAPSAFEAIFPSLAHDQATISATLAAAEEAFAGLRDGG